MQMTAEREGGLGGKEKGPLSSMMSNQDSRPSA